MEHFIHEQNLLSFRTLIAASAIDPARNEIQHSVAVKAVGKRDSAWRQAVTPAVLKFCFAFDFAILRQQATCPK